MSMVKEVNEDDRNSIESRFKTIITPTTPVSYDPEIKKKERSKNAQIAIEVNKVKKRANARTILKSYYDEWEENNKIIVDDLKSQRKQLEDKLMAIRNACCYIRQEKSGCSFQARHYMSTQQVSRTIILLSFQQ